MSSTAAPLTSLGKEISFADGSTARLRYSLGAMALLEQRHGSIDGLMKSFQAIGGTAEDGTPTGPAIGPLLEMIGAGLTGSGFTPHITERLVTVREETPDGRKTSRDTREITGVRYVRQSDRTELGHLLDFSALDHLVSALTAAFEEAFPTQGATLAAAAAPVVDVPSTFLGTNSSISGQSSSADQTTPSGP
ncbi:hypothetical protein AB0F42_24475 [Streptomyces buecherae]|uniref:hypothetical protein n=1 Tax=Streptomyces buecherae TaxID=2763006 RepID=UPI0033C33991